MTYDDTTYIESKTVEQLSQDNHLEFYFTPELSGDKTIYVEIDPDDEIEETDETNNEMSLEVSVKDTKPFSVGYVKVMPFPFTYSVPDDDEFSETVYQGGRYIKATFPVAEDGFFNEGRLDYIGHPTRGTGLIYDLIGLAFLNKLLGIDDRVIGIVSRDYFTYHFIESGIGVGIKNSNDAVLVKDGHWMLGSHELGHTYGLRLSPSIFVSGEEYDTNPPGNPATGFWIEEKKFINDAICIMGTGSYSDHQEIGEYRSIIFNDVFYDYEDGTWIDKEDYEHLFREFRSIGEDPEILLIGALVYKNGTIDLKNMYWLENRTIDEDPLPGNYSIQFLNAEDELINTVSFSVSFELYGEPDIVIETNVSGFVFPVYYPEDTSKILIQLNNETLLEVNPNIKLIRDAINLIPDHGFKKNPSQRRNALLNKIEAIEQMTLENNYDEAIDKLENDVKDKIDKWLVDDYEVEDPLQITKDQILDLIDEIIYRFNLF
ncbi:MAG: hypothetical protein KJ928_04645 [Candidatus Altiarchaeota archaeon]|nr:hypothetical protein [Candidatus Altiarchaeota archaeon]